jgi:hypothetical protein
VLVSAPATDRELVEALGALDKGPIVAVRRAPYRYSTSAPLEEVTVAFERGGEMRLILKPLSRDLLLGDARASKPEQLHDPRREIETYRGVLGPAGIGPRCLASGADWLLIEKVPGVELWQIGEFSVWEQVARWLGAFHARFAGRSGEVRAASPHLLEHDAVWFALWADRARAALAGSDDPRAGALVDALAGYDADALAALPRTFVHGELYPSNVLVVMGADTIDVRPVDWEMAAIGPGLIDLAALTGGWPPDEQAALEAAYVAGLGYAPHDLDAVLPRCRLHLALQWLGWAADWRPPPEHAHDWLSEALVLAQQAGLR